MDRTNSRHSRNTAKARGPYAVGDERRRRILDVAVEHFAQWGFHASSLARIAKEVGVTQGGLLHHFRSKEDLLVSVLEHSEEHDIEQFFTVDFDSAADCFRRLTDLVEYNSRRPGRTRMFNVLIGESCEPGHPAHAFFKQRYAMVLSRLTDTLRAAADAGELAADTDCTAVAQEIVAVMDGHQLQWALTPDEVDMAERLRSYFDRLYASISTAREPLPPKP
ncbi:TetR/AcrR family transcriptional regulator [Streptomyces sp. N35]|uniref:TetR/AcrR family transcriptional regulator n=1 Tax=Streptomyces sp. N35 TaxID=2795730 RepID=UPI0018F69DCE|nr:TetR/AcrR family transcriptional regulator [Streptomyces sp. N35]